MADAHRAPDLQAVRDLPAWLGLYLRGIAMGIAEVIPGVSGGTIAFVSGIYEELIATLASLRPSSLRLLRHGIGSFWRQHNLSFLLVLGLGMVTGVALFAHALSLALLVARPVVWAFFFGVILFSVLILGRDRVPRVLAIWFPPGLLLGLLMVNLDATAQLGGLWAYFFGAALAVAAWLLPAVSGSFLLLLLGLYEGVLAALVGLNLTVLGAMAAGALIGLICFANLLSFLMSRYREPVLSLLTGFMAGSIVRLWPWRGPDDSLLLPAGYSELMAASPLTLWVGAAFLVGMVAIWLLARLR